MDSKTYWEMRNRLVLDKTLVTNEKLAANYKMATIRLERKILELWRAMEKRGGITPANLVQLQRYVEIQNQIDNELRALGQQTEKRVASDLLEIGKLGVDSVSEFYGSEILTMSPQVIEQITRAPYKGDIFSNRIWKNTEKINRLIKKCVFDTTVAGEDVRKVSKRVSNIMTAAYNDSKRIVITETGRVFNEAARLSAKELGFKGYTLILEPTACSECRVHEKDYYDIDTSVLPFHPYCKCSIRIDTRIGDQ